MPPRMIKEYAGSERSKRLQQEQQFTFRGKLRRQGNRHLSQPYSSNGGTNQRREVVSNVGAVDLDLELVPPVFERPWRNRAVGTTPPEARVIAQLGRTFRCGTIGEMGRARNDGQRKRSRQPHRNHVSGAMNCPIRTPASGDDLDLDLRIGAAKRGHYWFQHDRDNASRYCEPEQAGWLNRELTCRFACRHE